jgi:hypothetical protein
MKSIKVKKVKESRIPFDWNNEFWSNINSAELGYHRKENQQFPKVAVKIGHSENDIILFWLVKEEEIVCNHKNHFDRVYQDSCVEFFVMPNGAKGYFNFEINCIGKILCYYVTDWIRNEAGTLKGFSRLDLNDINKIQIENSIEESDTAADEWFMLVKIPKSILISNSELSELDYRKSWRGNFYKCADASSLPHWSAWNPVTELNFHQPKDFGEIIFE